MSAEGERRVGAHVGPSNHPVMGAIEPGGRRGVAASGRWRAERPLLRRSAHSADERNRDGKRYDRTRAGWRWRSIRRHG